MKSRREAPRSQAKLSAEARLDREKKRRMERRDNTAAPSTEEKRKSERRSEMNENLRPTSALSPSRSLRS